MQDGARGMFGATAGLFGALIVAFRPTLILRLLLPPPPLLPCVDNNGWVVYPLQDPPSM